MGCGCGKAKQEESGRTQRCNRGLYLVSAAAFRGLGVGSHGWRHAVDWMPSRDPRWNRNDVRGDERQEEYTCTTTPPAVTVATLESAAA